MRLPRVRIWWLMAAIAGLVDLLFTIYWIVEFDRINADTARDAKIVFVFLGGFLPSLLAVAIVNVGLLALAVWAVRAAGRSAPPPPADSWKVPDADDVQRVISGVRDQPDRLQ